MVQAAFGNVDILNNLNSHFHERIRFPDMQPVNIVKKITVRKFIVDLFTESHNQIIVI